MTMGLKCSVLGHRFGETAVEREREEEGTEVVITITEIETCTRCGEERVVSENKEVTTMEAPEAPVDGTATDDGTADSDAPSGTVEADAADAEPADDADDVGPSGVDDSTAGVGSTVGPDTGTDDAAPETDDAEILDADGDEASAQAEARSASETVIPDAEGEAEPDAAATGDDDAIIIDDDEETSDPDRDPGEWPDEPDDDGGEPTADWPSDEGGPTTEDGASVGDAPTVGSDQATDDTASTGEATESESVDAGGTGMGDWPEETKREDPGQASGAAPTLDPEDRDAITVPEGMFKCSECGFTTEAESSSLRAGDFCPECHRGTLLQHQDDE